MKKIFALRHHHRVKQVARYATVSAISTGTSLTVLGVLVFTKTMAPTWANVVATTIGTIPSFELNRRWVWGKEGNRSIWAEVGPYLAITFTALALSTVAIGFVAHWADHHHFSAFKRTAVVLLTNIAVFGSVWVVQFLLLDKILFRAGKHSGHSRRQAAATDDEDTPDANANAGHEGPADSSPPGVRLG